LNPRLKGWGFLDIKEEAMNFERWDHLWLVPETLLANLEVVYGILEDAFAQMPENGDWMEVMRQLTASGTGELSSFNDSVIELAVMIYFGRIPAEQITADLVMNRIKLDYDLKWQR
jgi:hypothetical protein